MPSTLKQTDVIRKALSSVEDTIRSAYLKVGSKKYFVHKNSLYTDSNFTKIAGHFQNGMAVLRHGKKRSAHSKSVKPSKSILNKSSKSKNNSMNGVASMASNNRASNNGVASMASNNKGNGNLVSNNKRNGNNKKNGNLTSNNGVASMASNNKRSGNFASNNGVASMESSESETPVPVEESIETPVNSAASNMSEPGVPETSMESEEETKEEL